jgi:signal recognition particle receptor subunit beta
MLQGGCHFTICAYAVGHEHLAEVPILVLANKKDLRDAMTASELTTALALTDVKVLRLH